MYDETCNIKTNIYLSLLKGQSFPPNNPASNIRRRLNFGDDLKAKKSLMNWILTRTALLDLEPLLIEAHSIFEFLRGVYHTFVSKFWFIHPN